MSYVIRKYRSLYWRDGCWTGKKSEAMQYETAEEAKKVIDEEIKEIIIEKV